MEKIKYMFFKEDCYYNPYRPFKTLKQLGSTFNFNKNEKVGVWYDEKHNNYRVHKLNKDDSISLHIEEYNCFTKDEVNNLLIDQKEIRKEKLFKLNNIN